MIRNACASKLKTEEMLVLLLSIYSENRFLSKTYLENYKCLKAVQRYIIKSEINLLWHSVTMYNIYFAKASFSFRHKYGKFIKSLCLEIKAVHERRFFLHTNV